MAGESALSPGKKIALLRKARKLTQEEVAEAIAVHRGTIASYEYRPNASPSAEKVRKLAAKYDVPLDWFYDGADVPPPTIVRESVSGYGIVGAPPEYLVDMLLEIVESPQEPKERKEVAKKSIREWLCSQRTDGG